MNTNTPSTVPRTYDDFQPLSEWIHEEQSDIVAIHLPGFKKEQIRVQLDNLNTLKISGERALQGNMWKRFRQDFQVPEHCIFNQIRAKFENDTLLLMLPKTTTTPIQDEPIPDKPAPLPNTITSTAPIPDKPAPLPNTITSTAPIQDKPIPKPPVPNTIVTSTPTPIQDKPIPKPPVANTTIQDKSTPDENYIQQQKSDLPTAKHAPAQETPKNDQQKSDLPAPKNGFVQEMPKKDQKKSDLSAAKYNDGQEMTIKDDNNYKQGNGSADTGNVTSDVTGTETATCCSGPEIGGLMWVVGKKQLVVNVVLAVVVAMAIGFYVAYKHKSPEAHGD